MEATDETALALILAYFFIALAASMRTNGRRRYTELLVRVCCLLALGAYLFVMPQPASIGEAIAQGFRRLHRASDELPQPVILVIFLSLFHICHKAFAVAGCEQSGGAWQAQSAPAASQPLALSVASPSSRLTITDDNCRGVKRRRRVIKSEQGQDQTKQSLSTQNSPRRWSVGLSSSSRRLPWKHGSTQRLCKGRGEAIAVDQSCQTDHQLASSEGQCNPDDHVQFLTAITQPRQDQDNFACDLARQCGLLILGRQIKWLPLSTPFQSTNVLCHRVGK